MTKCDLGQHQPTRSAPYEISKTDLSLRDARRRRLAAASLSEAEIQTTARFAWRDDDH